MSDAVLNFANLVKTVKKSVKNLLTGKKVKRQAKIILPYASVEKFDEKGKPESFASDDSVLDRMLALTNGSLSEIAKWFDHGRMQHARIVSSTALLGATNQKITMGEKETTLSKLVKDFLAKVEATIEIMEVSKEEAIKKVSAKPKYAEVVKYFENLGTLAENVTFDFSATELSKPRWFSGAEDDENEEEEEDESTDS